MSKPSTSKKSRSRLWFLVHSWLALPIWFFVLIVCVTGTLAVISQEIVWLANPEIRASKPFDDAPLLSFDQVIGAIAKSDPEVIVQQIIRPDEAHFALRADINYPDGRSVIVYVNPYTGVIQGISPQFDFKQFTRALHGWWLVPFTNGYSWGWYLVSLLGLPLLASLVTGLVVYKRFWKGFFKPTLRFNQGARIFWGDFHRLSGIWSIWFIAVISITGTWFLIQAILADNQISFASRPIPAIISYDSAPLMPDGRPAPMLGADEALRIAQQRVPGLDSSFVSLPGNAFSPIEVGGRSGYPLMYQTLQINPYNGEIEQSRLLSDRNKLEFVTESMRPLHTGDFGGLWIKLIWFFFGLVLSMMVLSGLLIWTKRTALATVQALKRSAKTERAPVPKTHAALNTETSEVTPVSKDSALPAPSPLSRFWHKWRFHLNILLVLIPLGFMPRYFSDAALFRGDTGLGKHLNQVRVGPWSLEMAELWDEGPRRDGPAGYLKSFNARLCDVCGEQVKAAYLRVGKPRSLRAAGVIFFGTAYRMNAVVPIPDRTQDDAELWITLEGWDGSVHQASLPLRQASPATLAWLDKQGARK